MSSETLVSTRDGRVLRVEEAGDPGGKPVLMHHATPGAGHVYGRHVADAADRGIRLIGYDRPGYGGSTPQPGSGDTDFSGLGEQQQTVAEKQIIISHGGTSSWA